MGEETKLKATPSGRNTHSSSEVNLPPAPLASDRERLTKRERERQLSNTRENTVLLHSQLQEKKLHFPISSSSSSSSVIERKQERKRLK